MRIAVIGVGHVGLVTAGCLARWGHDVVGYDVDAERIATLQEGGSPFFEPGLPELVDEGVAAGRLAFSTDLSEALRGVEAVFVCVGTPPAPGGGPNLAYVEGVGRMVAEHASGDVVLIEKSTVPANTGERLRRVIGLEQVRRGGEVNVEVASNPEFLREGAAVEDTLRPDRIVYGTDSERARDVLRRVYAPVVEEVGCPVVETDVPTAELIKHASNAFLATKISFINAVAQICDRVGADVTEVARGMGLDQRIGSKFLRAGIGYGGSCFPKDVDAFLHLAREVGYEFGLLAEVERINAEQRQLVIDLLTNELWHLDGKQIAILGAAFKPGTDDLRESPALYIARELIHAGATVRIWDPVALEGVKQELPEAELFESPVGALEGAHAAVVATEWEQLLELSAQDYRDALEYPILVDGRNLYDPDAMLEAGLYYHSIGRPRR